MDFLRIDDEPPQEDKPPPAVDFIARCVSAFGLLFGEIQRYLDRVDTIRYIPRFSLCRRSINVPDFRAEGKG